MNITTGMDGYPTTCSSHALGLFLFQLISPPHHGTDSSTPKPYQISQRAIEKLSGSTIMSLDDAMSLFNNRRSLWKQGGSAPLFRFFSKQMTLSIPLYLHSFDTIFGAYSQ